MRLSPGTRDVGRPESSVSVRAATRSHSSSCPFPFPFPPPWPPPPPSSPAPPPPGHHRRHRLHPHRRPTTPAATTATPPFPSSGGGAGAGPSSPIIGPHCGELGTAPAGLPPATATRASIACDPAWRPSRARTAACPSASVGTEAGSMAASGTSSVNRNTTARPSTGSPSTSTSCTTRGWVSGSPSGPRWPSPATDAGARPAVPDRAA